MEERMTGRLASWLSVSLFGEGEEDSMVSEVPFHHHTCCKVNESLVDLDHQIFRLVCIS